MAIPIPVGFLWNSHSQGISHSNAHLYCEMRNCDADYDDNSLHTTIIRRNYVFLLETLDIKCTELLCHLFADQVVSAVERDDITAEKTSFRANEKLLSALSRKSPQQFQLFLDALDNCGQRHVRDVICDRPGLVY